MPGVRGSNLDYYIDLLLYASPDFAQSFQTDAGIEHLD
jgi:hypothetical protein